MKFIDARSEYGARAAATVLFLSGRKDLFDRITNKECLPWSDVRGRYWYPWKD